MTEHNRPTNEGRGIVNGGLRRSAELHSISIRENRRAPRKFPDRGCGEAQPQRLDCNRTAGILRTLFLLVTRCGWSFGHSRGPLVAAPPRCAVSPICNRQRVEESRALGIAVAR